MDVHSVQGEEDKIPVGYKMNCTYESRKLQEQNQESKTNVSEVRTNWHVKWYWPKHKE